MGSKKKQKTVAYYGDNTIIRCCIVADAADDRLRAYEAIKTVRRDNVRWDEVREPIWHYIKDFGTEHKAAPDIRIVRDALAGNDAALDQLALIEAIQGYSLADLRAHLDTRHRTEQDQQWRGVQLRAATIASKGLEVDGEWWQGSERSAMYLDREKARIFGGEAERDAVLRTAQPDWQVFAAKDGRKVPAPQRHENTRAMLEHHKITVRRNVMTGRREITVPDLDGGCADTASNRALAHVHELAAGYGLRPTSEGLERHLLLIEQPYHPAADWIRSRPWDGRTRLPDLIGTIRLAMRPDDADLDTQRHIVTIIETWLTTACKAALVPLDPEEGKGIAAQGMLVFTGDQGVGKTRWFGTLVPGAWFAEGVRLDPDNRDSVAAATGAWLAELGELDSTFRKADLAALKGFITSPRDTYRSPYAREVEDHPRRTVFCGTVNDPRFLRDETGNRRYWTVPVASCDPEALAAIDCQQLWAEVASWVDAGAPHWLPAETEAWLARWNQQYEELPPVVEAFTATWEPDWTDRARVGNDEIRQSLTDWKTMGRREMQSITSFIRRVWGLTPHKAKGLDRWAIKRRSATDGAGTLIDASNRFGIADDVAALLDAE